MLGILDMDGVLTNFIQGALDHFGVKTPIEEVYANDPGTWDIHKLIGVEEKRFYEALGQSFWIGLQWMPDGRELLQVVEDRFGRDSIYLWTSPLQTDGCYDGKKKWIRHHMPKYSSRLIVGSAKHLGAGARRMLIDDGDHNISAFERAGGRACKVPRIWNDEHHLRHRTLEVVTSRLLVA